MYLYKYKQIINQSIFLSRLYQLFPNIIDNVLSVHISIIMREIFIKHQTLLNMGV
jgi:hypothetical protein